MNRLYLTLPLALVVLFFGYYEFVVQRNHRAEQARIAAERAAVEAKEEAQRKLREAEALAEARRLAEEEARAEAERRARRLAQQREAEEKLRTAVAEAQARARETARRQSELEALLETKRAERTALQDEVFALEREVELKQIARRNADRELQRLFSIVTLEIAESSVLDLPELPSAQPTAEP